MTSHADEGDEASVAVPAPAAAGDDYDRLPYVSLPISYSQPSHLAAMAALHGLAAPAAATARVLEIGCASGGNIIPMAARFADARFLGIDLSAIQIEAGRRRVTELGLGNVELRHADIADVAFAPGSFDYVICHGVFSWVPPRAREAILHICSDSLAADGIAALSYNVLPGWHLRKAVRDMCLVHAGREGEPQQRVAKARSLLEQLARVVPDRGAYGRLLRSEAERLASRPGSYVLGELLAEHNEPFAFPDFSRQLDEHGLAYLCEADLHASLPDLLVPSAAAQIAALANGDALAIQQYTDFFTGRMFRRSLVVRSAHLGERAPRPRMSDLAGPFIASPLRIEAERHAAGPAIFRDRQGRTLRVENPMVEATLSRIARAYPASVAVADLLAEIAGTPEARRRLLRVLFRLVGSGRATLSTLPLRTGSADDPAPRVWAVARCEAAHGQPWVSSLQHEAVLLDPVVRGLIVHMTGATRRHELEIRLLAAMQSGAIAIEDAKSGTSVPPHLPPHQTASAVITRALERCARNALLELPYQARARPDLPR